MKRISLMLAMSAAVLLAQQPLNVFGMRWTVPNATDWKVSQENGSDMLQLLVGREPMPGPRRPQQFALLDMPLARHVTIEADVRPTKRSLIVVYAYRDDAHFNYVHFSTDTAMQQPVHNGVFHVYGGERVRISRAEGRAAFTGINQWFHIKVAWDGNSGEVKAYVDGAAIPALHAVDLSSAEGRVGIGSFDETGDFRNFKISRQ